MSRVHIAEIDYCDVFLPAFDSIEECRDFYEKLKQVDIVKYMFHQTARMIWLGDKIEMGLAKGRPSLQVLFYLIAAEAVAKTANHFQEEGQSRYYVKKFFENYCDIEDLGRIKNSIESRTILSDKSGIDFLYDIRCDVVRQGRYFDTLFPDRVEDIPGTAYIGEIFVIVNVTIKEIKLIILKAAKKACMEALKAELCSTKGETAD